MQGVGFRPFVYGLAQRHGPRRLRPERRRGRRDRGRGAGTRRSTRSPPRCATRRRRWPAVDAVEVEALPRRAGRPRLHDRGQRGAAGSSALIPADVATCDDCLRELFDPADRRYRYPFINCTQCGPRFTIVRAVPYDRPNTTMAGFPLCADCRREYEDPADRRFHAEPDRLPGLRPAALAAARGGRRACCATARSWRSRAWAAGTWRATPRTRTAVARLRARKHREDKPFALMTGEPDALAERRRRRARAARARARGRSCCCAAGAGAPVAPSVAPGDARGSGVMLPYTPLHHLLLAEVGGALVMTSGNRSDEPIAYEDGEARERLGGIADAFLGHDRPIHRRCEDSVVARRLPRPALARLRARARSPLPLAAPRPIVAVGAELKSTFCVARGREAFLSPHLGDLDGELAYRAFCADLELYLAMLGVDDPAIAHDLHPEYLATKWALEQDAELVGVQHHHAHAAACLAEHGEPGRRSRSSSTARATAPTARSGAASCCAATWPRFERVAHLEPVPLPGGEAAIREPWRVAAVYLERAGRPVPFERWPLVRQSLQVNAPLSSGMGRLFDAVAAAARRARDGDLRGPGRDRAGAAGRRRRRRRPTPGASATAVGLIAASHDDLAAGRPRRRDRGRLPRDGRRRGRGGLRRGRRRRRRSSSRAAVPEPAAARRDDARASRSSASAC